MDKLTKARNKIDSIDKEMARLFSERMEAVKEIAEYKKENGLKIYDMTRENEVIDKNSKLVENPLLREYYVSFLRENMAISRRYQERLFEKMKVAYCGTAGAFAHIATTKLYPTAEKIAFQSFKDAYKAVEDGVCDVAVLPVENSYNGEVGQVTDLMFSGTLYINSMFELEVSHDLLAPVGATLSDIKEVISHPQALQQCQEYLSERGFIQREYANTALAAKLVAEMNDKSVAAIASAEAAEIFGLTVLEKNINASRSNTTRFAVFTRSENTHPNDEMGVHTLLLFTVRNEAGALAKAIEIIGKHGFNMRALRSRPMKELLWQYYFYVEAEGNVRTENGERMLDELSAFCDRLKALAVKE